jgi:integrase/recombinase XerD
MSATLEDTKGNTVRQVPLSDKALRDHRPPAPHSSRPFVFWHGTGSAIANVDSSFYALVKRVARKAAQQERAFRRFRFHDLRHLFAVTFLREGRGTVYALQLNLGHKSIKTTEEYLRHLTPDEQLVAKHGAAQKAAQNERFGGENG